MAVCHYCSTTIVFGGVESEGQLFCDDRCLKSARLLRLADKVYPDQIEKKAAALHKRSCPKCGGPGPTDVHRVFHIKSALFRSLWGSTPLLCCRHCARKAQLRGLATSFLLGWWNIPWGLMMTPVQCFRNIRAVLGGPDPSKPSAELEKLACIGLAARAAQRKQPFKPPGHV